MFSENSGFTRGSKRDLWNPIASKEVADVNSAGHDFGNAGYSFTKKLPIEEFEKKIELVPFVRKEQL